MLQNFLSRGCEVDKESSYLSSKSSISRARKAFSTPAMRSSRYIFPPTLPCVSFKLTSSKLAHKHTQAQAHAHACLPRCTLHFTPGQESVLTLSSAESAQDVKRGIEHTSYAWHTCTAALFMSPKWNSMFSELCSLRARRATRRGQPVQEEYAAKKGHDGRDQIKRRLKRMRAERVRR